MKKTLLALAIGFCTFTAQAAVSSSDAAKLGGSLTPLGAEKSGNGGAIPSWSGGLTQNQPGFKSGGHYPDPYKNDKPLFSIDAGNLDQYKANLSPGQVALLRRYKDWAMQVYPTHRSAAFPKGLYAETKANATRVNLAEGGNGVVGTNGGVPFPIPQNGLEAIWNHLTRYRGDTSATSWGQAAVTASGDYTLVKFDYEYDFVYSNQQKKPSEREDNLLFYFLQIIKAPPRLAGSILLVHEFTDQVQQPRKAWTYNPGQRRVRLAPNVAYDNPGTAADGLRTNDDFGMYNGATDRYDWKLVGKKEIYVPYNAAKLNGPLDLGTALKSGHVDPALGRYELHRVWVVEANLKKGTSHLYKKRVFYIDEDSWIILVVDKYDNRDQLWRVDEAHGIQYTDVPMYVAGVEIKHDLQSGRYIALQLRTADDPVYKRIQRTAGDFTPNTLRDKGKR